MPDLIINTKQDRWVIAEDCCVLRLLLERRKIRANDLRFSSERECHNFIKTLFLLSFIDEQSSQAQSPIAVLGRNLVDIQAKNNITTILRN